jgi:ribonuclease Z
VAYARPELMVNLFAQRVIAHHTTPVECGRVFTQTKAKLAVYSHIVSLATDKISELPLEDMVKQTRETYSGPLEVGEDLMRFEIGDKVTVKRWAM